MLVRDAGPPCKVFLSASASCCTWIAYCNSCLAYSRSCMSLTLTCVGSVAQFVQKTMPPPTWALTGFTRSEPAIIAKSNLRIPSPYQNEHLPHDPFRAQTIPTVRASLSSECQPEIFVPSSPDGRLSKYWAHC